MRLISASALWWLLLGAPIIVLYLLKLKRTRRVVSSTLLWRRAIQEMQANVPFRKLRRNLLLILQLAILVLIVFALARPAVTSHRLARGSTIIVVDATASMGARDEEDGRLSRLDRAKEIARDMLSGVGGATRAALIEASGQPRLRSPLSSDRSRLGAALDDIHQTDEAGDLHEAVLLGSELAKAQQGSEVVVISDGGGPGGSIDSEQAPLRYVRVGQRANNVGIVAMNSRTLGGGRQELFASIANFGDTEKTVQAELRIAGALVDVRSITLGAASPTAQEDSGAAENGRRRSVIFDSLPPDGGLAELKLDVDDDLASDNVAYSIVRSSRRQSVGVATGNQFVWQALASDPDIDAHKVAPDQQSDLERYDVIVAEGDQVPKALKGNRELLCINPSDLPGFSMAEPGKTAPISAGSISADQSHPVNSYIRYAGVNFDQRKVLNVAGWLKPIVSDGAGGLIWAGQNNGKRTVLLGFDLAKTDLPVRMEFPILMANCIAWLSQAGGGSASSGGRVDSPDLAIRTGEPFKLQSEAKQISIRRPDGRVVQCEPRDGVATFEDTERVGVYTAKEPGSQFAASLLNGAESDTKPRDSLSSSAGKIESSAEMFKSEREIWTWALFGALIVIGVEWVVYLRRAFGA
jgi:Ca-activated chloride channel family protein